MINASQRMQALIEDLLAYSRIATMARPFQPVDLNHIIAAVCSDLEVAIDTAQARLEIESLITLEADASQLQQVFQNLISNALKFRAPDRTPVIQIKGHRTSTPAEHGSTANAADRKQLYTITITDNGIGFDNQYAGRIFGMFQRLHGRSEYAGTGIGLALCQRIVERHEGTITAAGIPGQGATFTITLPTRHPAKQEKALHEPAK
jgi:light-regulated signal transduction histidine kinase (bacteriophytochrome)